MHHDFREFEVGVSAVWALPISWSLDTVTVIKNAIVSDREWRNKLWSLWALCKWAVDCSWSSRLILCCRRWNDMVTWDWVYRHVLNVLTTNMQATIHNTILTCIEKYWKLLNFALKQLNPYSVMVNVHVHLHKAGCSQRGNRALAQVSRTW